MKLEINDRVEPATGWKSVNRQNWNPDGDGTGDRTKPATGRSRKPDDDETDDRAESTTGRGWMQIGRDGLDGWQSIRTNDRIMWLIKVK